MMEVMKSLETSHDLLLLLLVFLLLLLFLPSHPSSSNSSPGFLLSSSSYLSPSSRRTRSSWRPYCFSRCLDSGMCLWPLFAVPADVPQNCEWTSAKETIRSSDTEREAGEQTASLFSHSASERFSSLAPPPTAISLDSLCFHICARAISKLQQLPPECEEATYGLFFSLSLSFFR